MDEIEFKRGVNNLMVLTEHMQDTHIINAFKTVAVLLSGLNARIIEMQMTEDDDDE